MSEQVDLTTKIGGPSIAEMRKAMEEKPPLGVFIAVTLGIVVLIGLVVISSVHPT